ncbi:hypothetical protein HFO41_17635, partial [Rhizobium leguminosarum]
EAKNNGRKLSAPAASLDPDIRREFEAVSRALDERFGRDAILRQAKDRINRVPPPHRTAFEAMQDRLKILQQAVRMESSDRIISERRQRTANRGREI